MSAIQLFDLNGEQRFTGTSVGGGGAQTVLRTTVPVTAAQLHALDTAYVQLLPSPGPGFAYVCFKAVSVYRRGTISYTGAEGWDIGTGDPNQDPSIAQTVLLATSSIGILANNDRVGIFGENPPASGNVTPGLTEIEDLPLVLDNTAVAMAAGNGALRLTVWYAILALT